MKYKVHKTSIRTIKPNDPGFMLIDGTIVAPRAGFEISHRCPDTYKSIILDCIDRGWLHPVASVHDHELTFNLLKQ